MTRTVRRFSLVFVTAALCIPLGAADCLGPITPVDDDPVPCTLDTDCPDMDQCHPSLQVCETECIDDMDCSGDRPTCNVRASDGDNATYILEVDGIRDLCICNETSCGDGEECSAETGLCIPIDATTCDPANNGSECPAEEPVCSEGVCMARCDSEDEGRLMCGTDQLCDATTGNCIAKCTDNDSCWDDEICDVASGECLDKCAPIGDEMEVDDEVEVCTATGIYEAKCDDSQCAPDGDLCDRYTEYEDGLPNDDFNTCQFANDLTGWCADATGHTQDAGGPIITGIDFIASLAGVGTCAYPLQFFADVYSETPFNTSLFSQRIKFLENGVPGLSYSAGPSTALHPEVTDLGDNEYLLEFFLCGDMSVPPDFALFVSNNDGAAGNAYCFEGQ